MINNLSNMKRTWQVVADAKASYYMSMSSHVTTHLSLIWQYLRGKKAILAFPVTGLSPSPPLSSPSSFPGPPLPLTHRHTELLG